MLPELLKQKQYVDLFQSAAFKDFEAKIKELEECSQAKIDELTSSWKSEGGVNWLNFVIGERSAYRKVLDVKREMLEDVDLTDNEENDGD